MEHVEGINWQVIHELLLAEMGRVNADTTYIRKWNMDELNRMNDIAVDLAMKQS